MKNDNVREW